MKKKGIAQLIGLISLVSISGCGEKSLQPDQIQWGDDIITYGTTLPQDYKSYAGDISVENMQNETPLLINDDNTIRSIVISHPGIITYGDIEVGDSLDDVYKVCKYGIVDPDNTICQVLFDGNDEQKFPDSIDFDNQRDWINISYYINEDEEITKIVVSDLNFSYQLQ